MVGVPIAQFAPDLPELSSGSDIVFNVVPRTKESYGPLAALNPYADALSSDVIGAIALEDTTLQTYVFCGTAEALWKIAGAATAFTDVSGTTYSTGEGEYWRFAQYKNLVLATNFDDPIQVYDLSSSTEFADLSADAPKARFIMVLKGFVVVANTSDGVGGTLPMRLWWSAYNEPATWPTVGSATAQEKQSDYNDAVGPMGAITGLVSNLGGADGAVFFERGVQRMIYQGPPAIFGFYPAEGVRGCNASNSIVQVGPVVYYLGEDGFYVFDGTSSQPIGVQRVDKWFFSNVDQTHLDKVIGAVDAINKIVMWVFPSIGSSNGVCDMVLLYNWAIDRWSYAAMGTDWIFRALSFGKTLEDLDVYITLEDVPYSLDSRAWIGGQLQLAAFNSAHELSYFQGDNLAAQVATSEAQLFPGLRSWVNSIRPMIDGGQPTLSAWYRQTLIEARTYGPQVAVNGMGECPQRSEGRYVGAVMRTESGDVWDHFQGVDVTAEQAGWF